MENGRWKMESGFITLVCCQEAVARFTKWPFPGIRLVQRFLHADLWPAWFSGGSTSVLLHPVAIHFRNSFSGLRLYRRLDRLQFRVAMVIALFYPVTRERRGCLPFWD